MDAVRVCLRTTLSLQAAALSIGALWPRAARAVVVVDDERTSPVEALHSAVRCVQRLLYEHSLNQVRAASGARRLAVE